MPLSQDREPECTGKGRRTVKTAMIKGKCFMEMNLTRESDATDDQDRPSRRQYVEKTPNKRNGCILQAFYPLLISVLK